MQVLEDLTEDQTLTVLRSHNSDTSAALQHLFSTLPEPHRPLALLAHHPAIESHRALHLPLCHPDLTVQAMQAAVSFTALQNLHLCPWLPHQQLRATLQCIEALPHLTRLSLSGSLYLSEETCSRLSQILTELTKLQKVECEQCGLTSAACLALLPVLKALKDLRSLSLGGHLSGEHAEFGQTRFTSACASVLSAQFRYLAKLTNLKIMSMSIDVPAAQLIARELSKWEVAKAAQSRLAWCTASVWWIRFVAKGLLCAPQQAIFSRDGHLRFYAAASSYRRS